MMYMFSNRNRYLFILLLAVYSFGNSLFSEVYTHYAIQAPWYDILLLFTSITFFVWEGNRMLGYVLDRKFVSRKALSRLIIFFVSGIIFSSVISLVLVFLIGYGVVGIPLSSLRLPAILAFTYGTRINLFLHILNAVFFFISQFKNKQLEAEELKRINTQAQLQAIKNQINPHFLFNNLNVLSSMVMQENPDANKFIEEFSKVYRHVLSNQQKELVSLGEELEFVKPYLFLLEKRFPESIFVDISIPAEFREYLIIPISIQMLIENAIKHNIASRSRPLKIDVSVEGHDRLMVSNNLQKKPVGEPSTNIGLMNISKRYEIVTGKQIEIRQDDESFSVLIPLIQPAI